MKEKKILIVRKGHPGGGIERASSLMANFFASKGEKVVALSFYVDNLFDLDSGVVNVNVSFEEPANRVLRIWRTIKILRRKIKEISPAVILSYGEYMNIPVLLATRGLGIPVVVSDRLSPIFSLGFVYEILKRMVYRFADGCIAQTTISKNILQRKTGIKNVAVIPNPINAIEAVPCEKENRIITVGRLSPEKGQRYLIEAFAKLGREDWTLMLVGGYKEQSVYNNLVALTKRLNVEKRVVFTGRKSDFSKELSGSKIFVLPSLSEGYPNALIEAMSVPLPCISSDCVAGPSDIIEDGVNGLLVKPGDVDELVVALRKLIDNEELQEKFATRAYAIREKLAKEKITSQYLDYVKSFMN